MKPFRQPLTSTDDERFMGLALALSARHLGLAWPNPSVGAVVVREGIIVGQGVTQAGGRPHAEAVAIEAAGLAAVGATAYVTLEPCSHRTLRGATPCVEALALSGVRRVVSAMEDPNPAIAGLGHALLRSLGLQVTVGLGRERAQALQRGHLSRVARGRPSVQLKLARTADGYAARRDGPRLMITGEASNARTHLMRAHADAILVGIGTVLADDPLLNVRLPGLEARSPVRVVFDSALRIPATAQVVTGARTVPTWVVTGVEAPVAAEVALAAHGVEVMRVPSLAGRVDLGQALRLLGERGITRIFTEGGPSLAESLVAGDCLDEVAVATSDRALGEPGVPAVGPRLAEALRGRFRLTAVERLGSDRLELYERAA